MAVKVTEQNFQQVVDDMKYYLKKYGSLNLEYLDEIETEEEKKAYEQAQKELENGEAICLDFDKIKSEEDFLKSLRLEDV